MKTKRLNIIIYPSALVRNEAVVFSKSAGEFSETNFALDDKNYFPHITIYCPEFPVTELDNVAVKLTELSKKIKSFQLNFSNLSIPEEDSGIYANYELSSEVQKLRKIIIDTLNPLRHGIIRKKYQNDKSDDVLNFGYPINQYYFPHITLTSFLDNSKNKEFMGQTTKNNFSYFTVDTIALCEMGKHGTCTKIIKKFRLD